MVVVDASLTVNSLSRPRRLLRAMRRWAALGIILSANLLVIAMLWLSALFTGGRIALPMGYDQIAAGTVLLSQFFTLAMWSALSEPRSPIRWPLLVALCAASGLIVTVVFFPAWKWQYVGSRGMPWGVVFWDLYVNWMLIGCSGVVFLLAADIVGWPCRRILGWRILFEDVPVATSSPRGFGLLELFWWVGMAAAGCWLLRAMLENVLAENVGVVLIMIVTIVPPSVASSAAALRAQKRWVGLSIALAIAILYGLALGGILWTVSSAIQTPRNRLLSAFLSLEIEVAVLMSLLAAFVTFINASALRLSGAKLAARLPSTARTCTSATEVRRTAS